MADGSTSEGFVFYLYNFFSVYCDWSFFVKYWVKYSFALLGPLEQVSLAPPDESQQIQPEVCIKGMWTACNSLLQWFFLLLVFQMFCFCKESTKIYPRIEI